MSGAMLGAAKAAVARGFRIFPLWPGTKKPAINEWQIKATSDLDLVEKVWSQLDYNIGILCDDMIVLDADCKGGRSGLEDLAALNLPETYTVRTPTGGLHAYFRGPNVSNSVGKLAPGIDVRSKGGFVVGAGSVIGERCYTIEHGALLADAGDALVQACGKVRADDVRPTTAVVLDTEAAVAAAVAYLEAAPPAVEDKGGDDLTFRIACFLKDFGVSETVAVDLMMAHWNDRCVPPWDQEGIEKKCENAFRYGENRPGSKNPTLWFAGVDMSAMSPPADDSDEDAHYYDPATTPLDTNRRWLFHKITPVGGLAMLLGASGAGKTFLACRKAHCLATAAPFFGVEPAEVGGTIIIAAGSEGYGFNDKMAALGGGPLPIGMIEADMLRNPDNLTRLLMRLVKVAAKMQVRFGVPLRLVILETLSASGLVEDENSASQCSYAMNALSAIGKRLGVLVLVTHHPSKGGSSSRGSSSLINSADYVIEIKREPGHQVREVELIKARGAMERSLGSFTLTPVVLGQDDRGRPIDTMVATMGEAVTPLARKAAHADKLIEAVELVTTPAGDADMEEAAQTFSMLVKGVGNRRAQFKSAYEYCLAMGQIELSLSGGKQVFKRRGFE